MTMDSTYTIRKRISNASPNTVVGYYLLGSGPTATTQAIEVIGTSLKNIIETPCGTIFGFPSFGHRLDNAIFEPLSTLTPDVLDSIRAYMQEAVSTNYPLDVTVTINPKLSYVDSLSGKIVANVVFTVDSKAGIVSGSFDATI